MMDLRKYFLDDRGEPEPEPLLPGGIPGKPANSARAGLLAALLFVVCIAMALGGGWAVYKGMQRHPVDAPLPPKGAWTAAKGQLPVGADGESVTVGGKKLAKGDPKAAVTVNNYSDDDSNTGGWDDGSSVSTSGESFSMITGQVAKDTMKPMRLFVPALGIYTPIRATDSFVASRYKNLDTILVPSNPLKVAWYANGAPLVGGGEGTTNIAGHVAHNGRWGALHDLAYVEPGNIAWTTDAQGKAQKWMAVEVRVTPHKQYPQEYWSAKGVRQLVVTTCGGMGEDGHYHTNVFAIFKPVP